jgi:hypothetical protein
MAPRCIGIRLTATPGRRDFPHHPAIQHTQRTVMPPSCRGIVICRCGPLRFVPVMHGAHACGADRRCARACTAAVYRLRLEFP